MCRYARAHLAVYRWYLAHKWEFQSLRSLASGSLRLRPAEMFRDCSEGPKGLRQATACLSLRGRSAAVAAWGHRSVMSPALFTAALGLQSLASRQSMGLPVMRKCSPSSPSQFGHCSHGLCRGVTQGTVGTLKADRPPRGRAAAHHRPWVLDSLPKHSPYSPLGPSLQRSLRQLGPVRD